MLEIRGLTKRYRSIPAIEDVSFTAQPGEVTGYLGPNGSGKSTTIKIITGLLEADEGEVLYRGQPIHRDIEAFKALLGYVPEEPHLYLHLSGGEYLELVGQLRGIPEATLRQKIVSMMTAFGIVSDRHSLLSGYSKGMRQKVLLIGALLHDPEVIILDEPFSGLDVASSLALRRLIETLAGAGKTVLFSSHELDTVEKLARRVVILFRGRLVANNTVDELRGLLNVPTLEEIFQQLAVETDTGAIAARALEAMRL